MTGPRLLSWSLIVYPQIASTLSNVLGRKIKHVKLDEQGRIDSLVQAGVSDYFANFITRLELLASNDFEKATGDVVQRLTGHPPKSFKEFAEENKSVWNA
jgi:predicted phage-related endonuclease